MPMITNKLHLYESKHSLQEFIKKNITNSDTLMIQLFFADSNTQKIETILSTLNTYLPSSHIIGSTTDGSVLNANSLTYETIISFTHFEKSTLKHTLVEFEMQKEEQAAQKIVDTILTPKSKVLFIFADGLTCNGEKLIRAIDAHYPKLVIAGGLAADNAEFVSTIVCDNSGYSSKGIVALAIESDSLHVNTQFNFDWKPLGKEMKITKCDANRVYEINHISAFETYKKYLGENAAKRLPAVAVEFPLIIKGDKMPIARAALSSHEDGSLSFAGSFHEGQNVQLAIGNAEKIMNSGDHAYHALKDKPIEVIFVYSCMARRRFLQENVNYELHALSQLAPTSGFYTYGEFYTDTKSKELLNQTMTVVTLAEEESSIKKNQRHISQSSTISNAAETLEALTHLVDVTTHEIQDLNISLEHRVSQKTQELEELNSFLEKKIADEVLKNRDKDAMMFKQMRLAQMGEMISMIAHQWRQPLSTISAIASSLKLDLILGEIDESVLHQSLDKISKHTGYLSNTIDDFRNFFNPNKLKEVRDLDVIIEQAVAIIAASFKQKSIQFTQSVHLSKKVEIFSNELMQVLLNILKNAQDAFNDKNIDSPLISLRAYEDEYESFIEIADNAGGINEEVIEHIFDPYFSTKDEKNGTGLGLYMSKIIIEEHCGGKISVSNTKEGCQFKISIEHK